MKFPSKIAECSTLAQLYRAVASEYSERPAIVPRGKNGYQAAITYAELYSRGLDLATGLRDLGVQPQSHVAVLADNRAEWLLCDFAVLLNGAANVPRGTDSTDQEITYIINHSDSCAIIVEHHNMLERVLAQKKDLLRRDIAIIIIDFSEGVELPEGVFTLSDIETQGKNKRTQGDLQIENAIDSVEPGDLFTLIYTSGTTGTPKGVQLTHANIVSQIKNIRFAGEGPCLRPSDRMLSILPIWHSYERVFEVLTIAYGACTYYTSIRTVAEDLAKVQPTCMASAPRLWENLYAKIMASVAQGSSVKKTLFKSAYACSKVFNESLFFLKNLSLDLHGRSSFERSLLNLGHFLRASIAYLPHALLDTLVLKKIRAVVGGQLRGTISGGGALPLHVDQFFNFIGIPVLEGYGLTETAPVLAVRSFERRVIGTVGPMIEETEVKIIDLNDGTTLYPDPNQKSLGRGLKGEIHVRGPQVMPGYYKDVAQTQKVISAGWLNTGDVGMITFNDCLKIIGRSKDTIVLLNGENLEPQPIEAKLQKSALIDQCMVVGQDQKHLGALIVPAFEELQARLSTSDHSKTQLCEIDEAHKLMKSEIRMLINTSNGFKPHEM
ncbi:MAG: AMP-binding protein, partial [Verrucomicrobiota bacterium]